MSDDDCSIFHYSPFLSDGAGSCPKIVGLFNNVFPMLNTLLFIVPKSVQRKNINKYTSAKRGPSMLCQSGSCIIQFTIRITVLM